MAFRPSDSQERIIHRLKISKGHLEKIIEMTKNQEYCIDIMHQIRALEDGPKRNRKRSVGKSLENLRYRCNRQRQKK